MVEQGTIGDSKPRVEEYFRENEAEVKEYFSGKIRNIRIKAKGEMDILSFFEENRELILKKIEELKKPFKVRFALSCKYKLQKNGVVKEESIFHHRTKIKEIYESTNIKDLVEKVQQSLLEKSEEFVNRESGWIFVRVEHLTIEADDFTPMSGGTYKDLPERITKKKAVINIKNNDNKCFIWSILRSLNPKEKNSERVDLYLRDKVKDFNWEGITFPVDVKKGPAIFEKNNPGYKICIVGYDESQRERGGCFPLKPAKDEPKVKVIDLLLYEGHYCIINSLSRLLRGQYTKNKKKVNVCRNCFNHFYNNHFEKHKNVCFSKEGSTAKCQLTKKFVNLKIIIKRLRCLL